MRTLVMLAALVGSTVSFASPTVTDVTLAYSPATGKAEVSYTLSGGPAIVTFDVQTNGLSVGADNYAGAWGDIWKEVENGPHSFFWRPQGTLGERNLTSSDGKLTVSVKAWPLDDPPDWLVASLSTVSNVFFYTDAALLPGGVQADRYRCDWLVMRRIPAAGVTWRMGRAATDTASRNRDFTHAVTLSRDYYMSIYTMTREQTAQVDTKDLANLTDDATPYRPSDSFKWTECRGKDWPTDKHDVTAESLFGKLRGRTGLELDYATDAQWEYACRGSVGTVWNNGYDATGSGLANIGWYKGNQAKMPYGAMTQKVGLLTANAWGLYDMHGNQWEFTLDWNINDLTNEPELDPQGAKTSTQGGKVYRGGVYSQSDGYERADHRNWANDSSAAAIRLVCPVTMPDFVTKL